MPYRTPQEQETNTSPITLNSNQTIFLTHIANALSRPNPSDYIFPEYIEKLHGYKKFAQKVKDGEFNTHIKDRIHPSVLLPQDWENLVPPLIESLQHSSENLPPYASSTIVFPQQQLHISFIKAFTTKVLDPDHEISIEHIKMNAAFLNHPLFKTAILNNLNNVSRYLNISPQLEHRVDLLQLKMKTWIVESEMGRAGLYEPTEPSLLPRKRSRTEAPAYYGQVPQSNEEEELLHYLLNNDPQTPVPTVGEQTTEISPDDLYKLIETHFGYEEKKRTEPTIQFIDNSIHTQQTWIDVTQKSPATKRQRTGGNSETPQHNTRNIQGQNQFQTKFRAANTKSWTTSIYQERANASHSGAIDLT